MKHILVVLLLNCMVHAQKTQYVFPHYTFKDGFWETVMTVHNPTPVDALISARIYDADGNSVNEALMVIPANGAVSDRVDNLIPGLVSEVGWIEFESDTDQLRGIMTFTALSSGGTTSLPLSRQPSKNLVLPYLRQTESMTSGFVLVNPTDSSMTADVSAYNTDGTHGSTRRVRLNPRQKLVTMVVDFFGDVFETTIVKVKSHAPLLGFALSFTTGWSQIVAVPGEGYDQISATQNIQSELQGLLDTWIHVNGEEPVHGALLMVDAPDLGLQFRGASGFAAPNEPMTIHHRIRLASVGKTMTAATVLMLMEDGQLALDATLSEFLDASITDGLHVYQGVHNGPNLTLEQCLNHTTGLQDHFLDGDSNGDGFPDMLTLLLTQPNTFWDPLEVIDYAKENLPPIASPGQFHHYTDTPYVLLGLVIEEVTGMPLRDAYRQYIYAPLEMEHAWQEFREEMPSGPSLAHTYFSTIDFTDFTSVSADWGGGGQAMSLEDLNTFMWALMTGGLYDDYATLGTMKNCVPADLHAYGLGLERIDLGEHGVLWGHIGFSGAFMYYSEQYNATIVGTACQTFANQVDWVRQVLDILIL